MLVVSRHPRLQQRALEETLSHFGSPTLCAHSRALSSCSSSTEGQELRRGPAWSPASWGGAAAGTLFNVCAGIRCCL